MHFGPIPTARARGAILAHSLVADATRIRKGKVLDARDIAILIAAGHDEVVVAQLDAGDVAEDAAATRLAAALVPNPAQAGLSIGRATTGRVNLYATRTGVLDLDAAAILAANQADPMITVATLPPFARAAPRTMVATIKIIAYGVAGASLDAAVSAVPGAMRIAPVTLRSATLVETRIGAAAPTAKGEAAIRARLERLEMELVDRVVVAHDIAPIAAALAAADSDLVLVLTASATSDPDDVGPAAVRAAGGRVERFGMPVDPGNLLFFGDIAGRPVIGLPGCARSPALNGADWVLERVACGLPVTDADIAAMAVGGLLKETAARGRPREA